MTSATRRNRVHSAKQLYGARVSRVMSLPTWLSRPEAARLLDFLFDRGGRRRSVSRDYFFRVARHFTPTLCAEGEGVRYLVSTADAVVGRTVFVRGNFDLAAMRRIINVVRAEAGRDPLSDRTLVDVGANIGTTTLAALRFFGASRVIAFEPAPDNVALLIQNLLLNDVRDAVQVYPFALSDRDAWVELELSPHNWGDHRVRLQGNLPLPDETEGERTAKHVRARMLDGLIENGELDLAEVGLVWIDTQGHEARVFQGATRLLASQIPVVVEYWPKGLNRVGDLEKFHGLISKAFERVIVVPPTGEPAYELPADGLARIGDLGSDCWSYTDLVLLS
jgi:FkbM family methyltransferase